MHQNILKMKYLSILSIATFMFVASTVFTGCKYEDGPVVSLRSKKMRFTNIWEFTSVTLDGNDITSQYNRSDFKITFDVYKNGNYTFTLRDQEGKILSRAGDDEYKKASLVLANDRPIFMKNIGGSGSWTFVNDFNSVQLRYELSEDKENPVVPVFDIKELRNKKLKLSGTDIDSGKELVLEFEPLND